MMKKFLIVIAALLLAMASTSNATVVFTVGTGSTTEAGTTLDIVEDDTITVNVYDDAGGADYTKYVDMLKSQGFTMTTPVKQAAAGSLAVVNIYSTGSLYDFGVTAGEAPGSPPSGIHFIFTVTASGIEDDTVQLQLLRSGDYVKEKYIDLTIVPEPATIAILGLGALLLRRKK